MKNTIITLGLNVLCSLIFGQNFKTTIGIKLNPGIATIYNPFIKNINYSRFSASGGIDLRQNIFKDKFFIESGVFFLDKGFALTVNATDEFGNVLGEQTAKEIQYYLSVPMTFISKHNGIYFGIGPNINYYLARKFIINGKLISTDKSYQPKDIIFGFQILTGYEIILSEKVLVAFDCFINPTFKMKSLNYGLGIGIKYSLTKNAE